MYSYPIFTVRPWTSVDLEHDKDGQTLGWVLAALTGDDEVIAPVCGYNPETLELDALFQVRVHLREYLVNEMEPLDMAAFFARRSFDEALARAGVDASTTGMSIVEGDDPERLP